MRTSFSSRREMGLTAVLTAISVLAGLLLISGGGNPLSRSPIDGQARLISIEPLPVMDGPICELVPASTSRTLMAAAWQQEMAKARVETAANEATRAEVAAR